MWPRNVSFFPGPLLQGLVTERRRRRNLSTDQSLQALLADFRVAESDEVELNTRDIH